MFDIQFLSRDENMITSHIINALRSELLFRNLLSQSKLEINVDVLIHFAFHPNTIIIFLCHYHIHEVIVTKITILIEKIGPISDNNQGNTINLKVSLQTTLQYINST